MYYKVTVSMSVETEGKHGPTTKEKKENYLVQDETILGAETKVAVYYKDSVHDYRVVGVAETNFIDVIG